MPPFIWIELQLPSRPLDLQTTGHTPICSAQVCGLAHFLTHQHVNTQFYSPAGCDVVVWRKTAAEEKKRQKCQEEIFKCWKQDLISEIPKTLVLIISLWSSPCFHRARLCYRHCFVASSTETVPGAGRQAWWCWFAQIVIIKLNCFVICPF